MITLLELISVLEIRGKNVPSGKIVIVLDNRKVYRGLINDIIKPGIHTQNAGVEIAQIKRLLRKIHFKVEFKLVRGHRVLIGPFQSKPSEHLIRLCNEKSKITRESCK